MNVLLYNKILDIVFRQFWVSAPQMFTWQSWITIYKPYYMKTLNNNLLQLVNYWLMFRRNWIKYNLM